MVCGSHFLPVFVRSQGKKHKRDEICWNKTFEQSLSFEVIVLSETSKKCNGTLFLSHIGLILNVINIIKASQCLD